MTTTTRTSRSPATPRQCVICEVDAWSASEETVQSAISYCRGRDTELVFLWVFESRLFQSPFPGPVGGVGTWGPPWILRRALELAREQGIVSSAVVRDGERERVLAAEQEALQAEAVFPAAHRIIRCHLCHAVYDSRGIHGCPKVDLAA